MQFDGYLIRQDLKSSAFWKGAFDDSKNIRNDPSDTGRNRYEFRPFRSGFFAKYSAARENGEEKESRTMELTSFRKDQDPDPAGPVRQL